MYSMKILPDSAVIQKRRALSWRSIASHSLSMLCRRQQKFNERPFCFPHLREQNHHSLQPMRDRLFFSSAITLAMFGAYCMGSRFLAARINTKRTAMRREFFDVERLHSVSFEDADGGEQ